MSVCLSVSRQNSRTLEVKMKFKSKLSVSHFYNEVASFSLVANGPRLVLTVDIYRIVVGPVVASI